jgi:hypothetical protein
MFLYWCNTCRSGRNYRASILTTIIRTSYFGDGVQAVATNRSRHTWPCSMAKQECWVPKRHGRSGLLTSSSSLYSWQPRIVVGHQNVCIDIGCTATPPVLSVISSRKPLTIYWLHVFSVTKFGLPTSGSLVGISSRRIGWLVPRLVASPSKTGGPSKDKGFRLYMHASCPLHLATPEWGCF